VLPAAIEEQLDGLFVKLDTDKNGALQVRECLQAAGGSRSEWLTMLECLDTNADGKVTIEEWMRFFHTQWLYSDDSVLGLVETMEHYVESLRHKLHSGYAHSLPRDIEKRLEIAFGLLDSDRNGALDKGECMSAVGLEDAEVLMETLDVNYDGKVTIEEFMRYFNQQWAMSTAGKDSVFHILERIERQKHKLKHPFLGVTEHLERYNNSLGTVLRPFRVWHAPSG